MEREAFTADFDFDNHCSSVGEWCACKTVKINLSQASAQELMRFLGRARALVAAFHIQVHAAYLWKQQHQERQTPPPNHHAIKDKVGSRKASCGA